MTGTWILWLSIQLGIIIPTDFHIFQRGRYTTNQVLAIWLIGVTNLILFFLLRRQFFCDQTATWCNPSGMQLDVGYVERCHKNPARFGAFAQGFPTFSGWPGMKDGAWDFGISHIHSLPAAGPATEPEDCRYAGRNAGAFFFGSPKRRLLLSDLFLQIWEKTAMDDTGEYQSHGFCYINFHENLTPNRSLVTDPKGGIQHWLVVPFGIAKLVQITPSSLWFMFRYVYTIPMVINQLVTGGHHLVPSWQQNEVLNHGGFQILRQHLAFPSGGFVGWSNLSTANSPI